MTRFFHPDVGLVLHESILGRPSLLRLDKREYPGTAQARTWRTPAQSLMHRCDLLLIPFARQCADYLSLTLVGQKPPGDFVAYNKKPAVRPRDGTASLPVSVRTPNSNKLVFDALLSHTKGKHEAMFPQRVSFDSNRSACHNHPSDQHLFLCTCPLVR